MFTTQVTVTTGCEQDKQKTVHHKNRHKCPLFVFEKNAQPHLICVPP